MNDIFNPSPLLRISNHMMMWRSRSVWLLRVASVLVLPLGLTGCGDPNRVHAQLHSSASSRRDVFRIEIAAQVTGPQTGLHYKWFSVAGGCEPQESDQPKTSFKFAEGTTRDRVSVEVWHDGKRVGRSEIDVKLDQLQASALVLEQPHEDVQIEITAIPSYEPKGGPDTHADIGGKVQGKFAPDYNVVIYADRLRGTRDSPGQHLDKLDAYRFELRGTPGPARFRAGPKIGCAASNWRLRSRPRDR
jgi:hypothetical protein